MSNVIVKENETLDSALRRFKRNCAKAVLLGKAPESRYADNAQSFSCNEVTIYWNSPMIYLMSGLGNTK